ncbi:hypothetical protein ACFQY7_23650 [Actinomadura luteofluorescens]|uniref:hypothetical protein n=1 Tax=Actinomadura luteofluorescens TaxID=46163 RepID=UPI00363D91C5
MPTPPGRRPRKAPSARQPLTQELVVDTAIRVLDAEGLEAVTMRRVAQELGTGRRPSTRTSRTRRSCAS